MNLLMLLEMAAEGAADRIALGSRHGGGLTYRDLLDRSRAVGVHVQQAGVDAVVLCDESSPAVPLGLFGAAAAGVPYAPINYRHTADDLIATTGRLGRSVVVTGADPDEHAPFTAEDAVVTISRDRLQDIGAAAAGQTPPLTAPDTVDPDGAAVLLFTSGTSGPPKTAVLRHHHLVSYILGSVEFLGADDDEAALVSVPPYHVAGVAAMLSSVYAGRRIVQLPRFDPHAWLDLVESEAITHAMVVPTMLARIVDALDERGGEPVLGLRALSYGGGKMPRPVIERALELFPITSFVNAYGLTETSSTIALLGPDDHRVAQYSDEPAARARLASVGRPLPGVEIAVRDDDGNDLPPGDVGEIHVRGEQVAGEYREQGSRLDADGWFPTRDGGYLDADGYLFLRGRNDDIIIRGGENLSPGEIEDVAIGHPAVRDAAAVGVPSREWGEQVLLVVVPDGDGPSPDDLRERIRKHLRSSRVPAYVEFVDELPYNDTGKLLRRSLRAAWAHLGDPPD